MFLHHMGMRRGAVDTRSVGTDSAETEGRGLQSGGKLTRAITVAPAPAHATMYRW